MGAAGVEPDISVENAQLIDSENAGIGMIFGNAKSTVRSLVRPFPSMPTTPKLHLRTAPLGEKSILKCVCSISQILLREFFVGPESLNLAIPTPAGPNDLSRLDDSSRTRELCCDGVGF